LPANPKISLLVTAYNFEKFIGRAVESLLNQEGNFDYEVIVVDDCSTDRTDEVMKKFRDERLRYVRNEKNLGAVGSANAAFELARGEYIARFDGDDEWYPWFLKETVPVLDAHPEIGLVYGDIHTLDEQGVTHEDTSIDRPALPNFGNEFVPLLRRHYICAPTMLGRREAWMQVLPYPERLKSGLADWFLTLKMARDWDFHYVPKAIAKYRMHGGGMHSAFVLNKHGENNMRYILDFFTREAQDISLSQREIHKIYGRHYRHCGNSYFGAGMDTDARRCYLEAVRFDKSHLFSREFFFLLMGSMMGKTAYDSLKNYLQLLRKPGLLSNKSAQAGA
jgi:glycosyltransferase involved in cell wall biosynthesis